jgi:hypothetical protein
MFIVVILAVTEARGTAVRVRLPLAQEPPASAERVLLLCIDGQIRLLSLDHWIESAAEVTRPMRVTFNTLPRVIDAMNESVVEDAYFTYKFEMRESGSNFSQRQRRAIIIVDEKSPVKIGLTLDHLRADPNAISEVLDGLDPATHWISFQVDEVSIAVFREARALLAERGYANGWDPADWSFPLRETVLGGGTGDGPGAGREVQ